MAGTEYTYTIRFQGAQALADATAFKKDLEAKLGTLTLKTRLDTGSLDNQIKSMTERAGRSAGTVTARAMQNTIDSFRQYATRSGAGDFIKPLQDSLAQALAKPSAAGVTAINQLEESMRKAQTSTQRLGFTLDEYMGASAWEKRFGAIQAAQRRLWGVRGLGFQIASYGRQMMVAGAGAVGSVALLAKQYVDFAAPLNRAARNLDLNIALTEQLDASLRKMSGTLSYLTPQMQAEVLYMWAAATGEVIDSSEELNDVLTRSLSVQKLMILGGVDQKVAVESITDVISQYGMNVSETESIVDTFITVAANSKAEVGDLAMAFSYAGTRAAAANTDFAETAAIMELLAAKGLRGSRAGRGVSRLIENLIAPSNVGKAAMEKAFMDAFGQGTEILTTAEGEFVGLAQAISLVADATEEMTPAMRANFVALTTTENAARALTPLLEMEIEARRRGFSILDEFIAKQRGVASEHQDLAVQMMQDIYGYTMNTKSATDTAADYWDQYAKSVQGRMDSVKAAWSGVLTTLGKSATAAVMGEAEALVGMLSKLSAAAEKSPWVMEAVLWGGIGLVTVGALVTALGKGLTLVADVKAIFMAATMKRAADENVASAMQMVGAAATNLEAAGLMMAAANVNLAASRGEAAGAVADVVGGAGGSAAGGAAAGAGTRSLVDKGKALFASGGAAALLKALMGPAVGIAIATAITEGLARLTTGQGLAELLGSKKEEREGRAAGEAALPTMSPADVDARIAALQEKAAVLEGYIAEMRANSFELSEATVPQQYMPKPGEIVGEAPIKKIEDDLAAVNAELEVYQTAMKELGGDSLRWMAMGAWWTENAKNYRLSAEGIREMTEEEKAAQAEQEAFNRQIVAAKNIVATLGAELKVSEDAVADWSDAWFDGTTNIGLGMSQLEMAIQMMNRLGGDLDATSIAIAGGMAADAGWEIFSAQTGGTFEQAQAGYEAYLIGLKQMLSESQAATATELQWEIDAYRRSWEERQNLIQEYRDEGQSIFEDVQGTGSGFAMQFAGTLPYQQALEAGEQFQREQDLIWDRFVKSANRAGKPINFTALNYALAANAAKWEAWGTDVSGAVRLVDSLRDQALSAGWSALEGLAPMMGKGGPSESAIIGKWTAYKQDLDALMKDVSGLSEEQQKLRVAAFIAANQEETASYGDSIEERKRMDKEWADNRKSTLEQAQENFRSMVSQALTPTDVSQEDVMATKAGNYKDKWDEYARQVRAAMAGSQEWDWMIPADVKAGGEQAINQWGQNLLDNFYAGLMPDQVDWDAFAAQFEKGLKQAAGKEALIDRAIKELEGRGITATRQDVVKAMGMESPFQQYFFGGLDAKDATKALEAQTGEIVGGIQFKPEDMTTAGQSWSDSLVTAMDAQLASRDMITPLVGAWDTQLTEKGGGLESLGWRIGDKVWAGLEGSINKRSIIDAIVDSVLRRLDEETANVK